MSNVHVRDKRHSSLSKARSDVQTRNVGGIGAHLAVRFDPGYARPRREPLWIDVFCISVGVPLALAVLSAVFLGLLLFSHVP